MTVYDTVPTFVVNDSVFTVYQDYTFTANVYNPYNYEVEYEWYTETDVEDPDIVVVDTTTSISTLHVYFTKAATLAIRLRVIMNGDTTDVRKEFDVKDRETNAIGMRTGSGDYMQRIFGERAEKLRKADELTTYLLNIEQDTMQTYNDSTFYLSELQKIFPQIEGFHIINRKIYIRAKGLWVANIDGTYLELIDGTPCYAMTLDAVDNRIYWAVADEVRYMPLIGSDNNQFVTEPRVINNLEGVTKIAVDN